MTVFVGTSGWQYDDWRPAYYPEDLAKARWLEQYASGFATVEVNNAFYRLPSAKVFEDWRARTPEDFVVAVKASRYLTHVKRLKDPEEPVARLLERCRHLGDKLGPVLLQLPPTLRFDPEALSATLDAFAKDVRVAVEPRHDSWFTDETACLLARHNAAYCLSDSTERKAPRWRTADFGYLRFHAGTGSPRPCYRPGALTTWARWLAEQFPARADVFVYFNNDTHACALRDAIRFAAAAGQAGLRPTRVPPPRSVRLARG